MSDHIVEKWGDTRHELCRQPWARFPTRVLAFLSDTGDFWSCHLLFWKIYNLPESIFSHKNKCCLKQLCLHVVCLPVERLTFGTSLIRVREENNQGLKNIQTRQNIPALTTWMTTWMRSLGFTCTFGLFPSQVCACVWPTLTLQRWPKLVCPTVHYVVWIYLIYSKNCPSEANPRKILPFSK